MTKDRKQAKKPKKPTKIGGPFLVASVFCENVIEEAPKGPHSGGVMSALRIVDTITTHVPAGLPPGAVPGFQIWALIAFKAGDSRGNHRFALVGNTPDGKRHILMPATTLKFPKRPEGGANIKIRVTLEARIEGVYWFDVLLDGRRVSRMPLRVVLRHEVPDEDQKTA
jgi:hypothetical protein